MNKTTENILIWFGVTAVLGSLFAVVFENVLYLFTTGIGAAIGLNYKPILRLIGINHE